MKRVFLEISILLVFLNFGTFSQNLDFYTDKAAIVAQWLVRSTAHQSLSTATPIDFREDLRQSNISPTSPQHKSEIGLTSMRAMSSKEVREAYDYFELGVDAPKELDLLRFQFTKSIGKRMDFSISYLFVPDIAIHGQGAHLSLNILKLKNFYTTLRTQYSWVKKAALFKTQSLGIELSQSWNTPYFDIYVGTKYYHAKTHFFSNSIGGPIPTLTYNSPPNKLENFAGFSRKIYKNIRFDGQIKVTKKERSVLAKITFTLPKIKYLDGEWRLPTIY